MQPSTHGVTCTARIVAPSELPSHHLHPLLPLYSILITQRVLPPVTHRHVPLLPGLFCLICPALVPLSSHPTNGATLALTCIRSCLLSCVGPVLRRYCLLIAVDCSLSRFASPTLCWLPAQLVVFTDLLFIYYFCL